MLLGKDSTCKLCNTAFPGSVNLRCSVALLNWRFLRTAVSHNGGSICELAALRMQSNGTVRNDCHRFVMEVLSLFTSVCRSEVHGGSRVLL